MEKYKGNINFSIPDIKAQGNMLHYSQAYMDEKDLAEQDYRQPTQSVSQSLEDFANSEPDIYAQKRNESKTEKSTDKKEINYSDVYEEANETLVQTPTLEEYFDRTSKGISPIDKLQGVDYENSQIDEAFGRVQEALQDEKLYKKELLARMFGGKLTARQFEVLCNMSQDELLKAKMQEKMEETDDYKAKDFIKMSEEILESSRRKMVIKGEWTEEESRVRLNESLDQFQH